MNLCMRERYPKYQAIVDGKARPRFRSADLESKIETAKAMLKRCELCSHLCEVDRTKGEIGLCHVQDDMLVTSCFEHMGEEFFLVPSFTVFFASCTFECQFCQNWDISRRDAVKEAVAWEPERLAAVIDQHANCKNVNFVGGEPTPHIPFILDTISKMKADLPVVYNSNFFMSHRSMALLSGVVDLYLSDFKYGSDECAMKFSGISHYFSTMSDNHMAAAADAELLIRHLIMPNHIDCCTKPILEFIAEKFGDRVTVNLMDQYRPMYKAKQIPEISRAIDLREFEMAVGYAEELGLDYIT